MSKRKGTRREVQCANIYERAGWDVQQARGTRYAETDWWGLFDLGAINPEHGLHLIQVKSNGASGGTDWSEAVAPFQGHDGIRCLFLVCHDAMGWQVLDPALEPKDNRRAMRVVYDEREDAEVGSSYPDRLNMGEGLQRWLEAL